MTAMGDPVAPAIGRTGVILAAGFGLRLRRGGADPLKPLTPVAGTPLLLRTLRGLQVAGCERAVIVLGHGAEEVEGFLARNPIDGVEVRCVANPDYRLKNGVSVLAAGDHVGTSFLLTMADHVIGDEVMALTRDITPPEGGATLLTDERVDQVFDLDDATKVHSEKGRIVAIGKELTDYDCIDTGLFVCTRGLLAALARVRAATGDASLTEGMRALAATGRAHIHDIGDGFWQDVDTQEMLEVAERELRQREGA